MFSYILTGFTFVVILGVLVTIHEFGHYMMAKRAGMEVEEFGFGLPPRIKGCKKWGTLWSLNAIPIGGFVRVRGGDTFTVTDKELNDKLNYHSKTWWERFWFIVAGVIMNLILAVVIFSFGYMYGMKPLPGSDLYNSSMNVSGVMISQVIEDSPAFEGGLMSKDLIKNINGVQFEDIKDFSEYVSSHKGEELRVTVTRDNVDSTYYVTPSEEGKIGAYVSMDIQMEEVQLYPHKAIYNAVLNTWFIAKETLFGLARTVGGLLTSFSVPDEVSGPVGIVNITHQVVQVGFIPVLQFAAILSISLAVLNIIPFPALDGGRLLFLFVEAIIRRRVSAKIENYVHLTGFALLMILILAVTYKDILSLF